MTRTRSARKEARDTGASSFLTWVGGSDGLLQLYLQDSVGLSKGLEPCWSLARPYQHSESPPCTLGHQQESHVAPLSPRSTAVCAARPSSALTPTWFLPSCAFWGPPCSASPRHLCVPLAPAPSEPWLSLRPWFPVVLFCPHPVTPGLLGAVPLLTSGARPLSAHPQGHPVSGDDCVPLLHLHSPHAPPAAFCPSSSLQICAQSIQVSILLPRPSCPSVCC